MRLLPKYLRLTPTEEPPAEKAHKPSYNNNHSDGDTGYGTCAEATLVRASTSAYF